jgi:hypothetical protein
MASAGGYPRDQRRPGVKLVVVKLDRLLPSPGEVKAVQVADFAIGNTIEGGVSEGGTEAL